MVNTNNAQTSPMAGFFMLLSIIPISFFLMIAISQHMQITGDLEVEEERKRKRKSYEEKYP